MRPNFIEVIITDNQGIPTNRLILVQAHTDEEALERVRDHYDPARHGRFSFETRFAVEYRQVLTCRKMDDILTLI